MIQRSRRFVQSGVGLLLLVAVVGGLSCGDPTAPEDLSTTPPDVRQWVTGEAAAALDADGHFVFSDPVSPGPDSIVETSAAAALAMAYIRTYIARIEPGQVGTIRHTVERVHGGTVDWDAIALDPRLAYWAATPFEPLPDSVPLRWRRPMGPWYLIPGYVDGEQVVCIAVAAYATDTRIDERGLIDFPVQHGNEFESSGVPRDLPFRVPAWPEEAVRIVAEATGARVTEVPVLVAPGGRWAPHGARWRIELDREIRVRDATTGARIHTRTVYLGLWPSPPRLAWLVPADVQPASQRLRYLVRDETGSWVNREIEVPVRAGVPVTFVEVGPLP